MSDKNADGQAGQEHRTAPSQEGHAAGPACSAPDGEPLEPLIRPATLAENMHSLIARHIDKFSPAEKREAQEILAHLTAQRAAPDARPTLLDVQARIDAGDIAGARAVFNSGIRFVEVPAPDEALIKKIGAEIDKEWEDRRVWSPADAARKAIREYIRRSAGKEKG